MKMIVWVCAFLCLAASAGAQTLVPGLVKHETWTTNSLAQVEAGTQSPTVSTNITYNLTSWDAGDVDLGFNYADRLISEFTVDTTGAYDFWVASDNESAVFLAIDDNPTNKVMIAQQPEWSTARQWTVLGPTATGTTANGGPSQKSSATWTNGPGATPWAAGFTLTNGQRYYLEAVRQESGGEDHFAVTLTPHGTPPPDGW
jgi:hypothetical protein